MSVNIWNKTTHVLKRAAGKPGLFTRLLPGLVPTAPSGNGTSKYLREDGSWTVPSTNAAQSGTAQSAVESTIAAGTSMDDVAKTLLENDATLKDALNYKSYTTGISYTDSSATSLEYYIDVFGKFAILSMVVSTNELDANTWNLIGTLPIGLRPAHTVWCSSASTIWQIFTDGRIKVYSPWGKITLTSDRICVTYPI